jgi:biotin transport system substrate-specific component
MNIKRLIKISMFSAMLVISVILLPPITVPIIMVPLTLQLFVIVLIGFVLKPVDAFISIIIYVLLGAIGLPVFSQGQGGLSVILGPTGGFIMMFPFVGLGISMFKSKKDHMIYDLSIGILIGIVVLYVMANLWLTYVLNLTYIQGLIPLLIFIPIDLVKIGLAYVVYRKLPKDLLI